MATFIYIDLKLTPSSVSLALLRKQGNGIFQINKTELVLFVKVLAHLWVIFSFIKKQKTNT